MVALFAVFGTVIVRLHAQNGSEEIGTAVLTPLGARTRVAISVGGEPAGAIQPANLHLGTCDDIETIRHTLRDVRGGRSITLLDVRLARLTSGRLIVDVQGSPASLYAAKDARSVSCGAIPPARR
jgi:hypothetical protein